MRTDKQLYEILAANPEWLFELTQLESPGPCQFKSVTLKAIERTADGVIYPESPLEELTVVEVQFQRDDNIYRRIAIEMALVHQSEPQRPIQGVLLFLHEGLDPATEPWRRIIRSYSLVGLIQSLAARDPNHPLVAVFVPVMAESEELLEANAAECYNKIKSSNLSTPLKEVQLDVFVS